MKNSKQPVRPVVRLVPTLGGCPAFLLEGVIYVEDTGDPGLNAIAIRAAIAASR